MRKSAAALAVLLAAATPGAIAQSVWPPPSTLTTLNLWPAAAPDPVPTTGPEADTSSKAKADLIAGNPIIIHHNVSVPTLTVYPAKGTPNGTAVVVFPGGGYNILAIDLEGTEVCDWLNGAGIACLLVKYRVPDTGPYPKSPAALEDAQRAVSITRVHAAEWHIDPNKIGVLGCSAGGHLAAAISTHYDKRLDTPVDATDQVSCRPDFAVVIYPGYLADETSNFLDKLDLHPTEKTPPTFIVQAEDDPVHVENATTWFLALKKAKVPAELHLYAEGGHGYGLRPQEKWPITTWPKSAELWLHTIHMVQ